MSDNMASPVRGKRDGRHAAHKKRPASRRGTSASSVRGDVRLDMGYATRRNTHGPQHRRDVGGGAESRASKGHSSQRTRNREGIKDNPRGGGDGGAMRRKGTVSPRRWPLYNMFITAWLIVLTILAGIALSRTYNGTSSISRTVDDAKGVARVPRSTNILHRYPFNIYDAAPGHVIRYPAANGSGIPNLRWKCLTWYKVCCKHEKAFRCYPPEYATLRQDVSNARDRVYLELIAPSRSRPRREGKQGGREKVSLQIGEIGSRCNLYWSEQATDDFASDAAPPPQ